MKTETAELTQREMSRLGGRAGRGASKRRATSFNSRTAKIASRKRLCKTKREKSCTSQTFETASNANQQKITEKSLEQKQDARTMRDVQTNRRIKYV